MYQSHSRSHSHAHSPRRSAAATPVPPMPAPTPPMIKTLPYAAAAAASSSSESAKRWAPLPAGIGLGVNARTRRALLNPRRRSRLRFAGLLGALVLLCWLHWHSNLAGDEVDEVPDLVLEPEDDVRLPRGAARARHHLDDVPVSAPPLEPGAAPTLASPFLNLPCPWSLSGANATRSQPGHDAILVSVYPPAVLPAQPAQSDAPSSASSSPPPPSASSDAAPPSPLALHVPMVFIIQPWQFSELRRAPPACVFRVPATSPTAAGRDQTTSAATARELESRSTAPYLLHPHTERPSVTQSTLVVFCPVPPSVPAVAAIHSVRLSGTLSTPALAIPRPVTPPPAKTDGDALRVGLCLGPLFTPPAKPEPRRRPPAKSDPSASDLHSDLMLGLVDFLFYHRALGVQQFYVYVANTSPATAAVLDYFRPWVLPIPWQAFGVGPAADGAWYHHQTAANNDCLNRFRTKHDRILFVDTDEFLVPRRSEWRSVSDMVRGIEAEAPSAGARAGEEGEGDAVAGAAGLARRTTLLSRLQRMWRRESVDAGAAAPSADAPLTAVPADPAAVDRHPALVFSNLFCSTKVDRSSSSTPPSLNTTAAPPPMAIIPDLAWCETAAQTSGRTKTLTGPHTLAINIHVPFPGRASPRLAVDPTEAVVHHYRRLHGLPTPPGRPVVPGRLGDPAHGDTRVVPNLRADPRWKKVWDEVDASGVWDHLRASGFDEQVSRYELVVKRAGGPGAGAVAKDRKP
ncbi:hypothetical protein H9P43_003680 [Blastocladiella emersonii ATCC 22665]|nr:hypothetical protein H9P43_003680 [Blastocladiella emersonii ATCC 22665]